MTPPPGFEWVREHGLTLLVRSDVRSWITPILTAAPRRWAAYATRPLSRGRGGTVLVEAADGHAAVVRACLRGGLPARVLADTYVGWHPRPFREVSVIETMRARGLPVIDAYGAAVQWRAPGCYRGWVATRYIAGARTVWEWAMTTSARAERRAVFANVGIAIRCLHEGGGRHPDLNLNNILVGPDPTAPNSIVLIDFDRAGSLLGYSTPERELRRLRRSANKLDPNGKHVSSEDLDTLLAAYREGAR